MTNRRRGKVNRPPPRREVARQLEARRAEAWEKQQAAAERARKLFDKRFKVVERDGCRFFEVKQYESPMTTNDHEIEQLKHAFFNAWTGASRGAHVLGPNSLHSCAIKARKLRVSQETIADWHREWRATRR